MSFIMAGCVLLLALIASIILDDTGGSLGSQFRQSDELAFPHSGNP